MVAPARSNVRRNVGVVFLVAALLCAAGCGLGYQSVYRHDRAVERTRTEIAAQGPRIVEQMLSYGTATVKDDFARAQSLATDGYRSQLVDQQQAVQKAGVDGQRVLGRQQRHPVGVAGSSRDAAGSAGAAR